MCVSLEGSFTRYDLFLLRRRFLTIFSCKLRLFVHMVQLQSVLIHIGIAHRNCTEWVWNPFMYDITHTNTLQSHCMNSLIDIHTTHFLSQKNLTVWKSLEKLFEFYKKEKGAMKDVLSTTFKCIQFTDQKAGLLLSLSESSSLWRADLL